MSMCRVFYCVVGRGCLVWPVHFLCKMEYYLALKNAFASVLQCSAFCIVQLSHPYMTTGKNIALTIWTLSAKRCLCFLICCLGLSEKTMAPHSSTLAWKIPWTEEPGGAIVHGVAKSRTQVGDFTFTFHFHALEKAMAAHSSVLAWRIPGTEEPGGRPSMWSHRVEHGWRDLAAAAAVRYREIDTLGWLKSSFDGYHPLENPNKLFWPTWYVYLCMYKVERWQK